MTKNRKKILAIDDDPGLLRLLEKRLKSHGFDVIAARGGKEGIEKAKSESPDLIILDVLMPDLSGGDVARQLMLDEKTRRIPVVFLTVTLSKKDKKEIEIDGWMFRAIAKPFYQPELLSAIRHSLKSQ